MHHNHTNHPHSIHRRLGTLAAAATVLSTVGLVAAGAAYAGDDDDGTPWPGPVFDPDIPINTVGPIITGPIYTIPAIPFPDDDGPIYNGPIFTIPAIPFDPSGPTTTAPVDTPPEDTGPVETPPPTDAPAPTPAPTPEAPPSAPAGDVPPFLVITSATLDCSAVLHVTFETGASPQLAPDAEHVVMFSPASNPAAVTAQRLVQRPQNGVFTLDLPAPVAEQYRVIVTADFEPGNLEGVLLVDEADAPAPLDCPVPTPTG